MDELGKCDANYVPLTPLTFLKRAANSYANHTSVIYERTRFTWLQTYLRCCRLASSLSSLNVLKNDVVSVLAPNIPAMYEMHFAVPMAGAVLNTINTRLNAKTIATILRHSGAKIIFVDYQFIPLASKALEVLFSYSNPPLELSMPSIIIIDDIDCPTGIRLGELEYEQLVQKGNPNFKPIEVEDEWDPITLNYTSGTTSEPKGVVYSHRGSYLSTLSLILGWEMGIEPVYLWTLPMFHCNGWTFTWGVAARGGTNVCIRNPTAYDIYDSIKQHKITHMCCAPIIFNILLEAKSSEQKIITNPVHILTGGAPPAATLLEKIEALGFHVTHAYGLTEATGPALVCEWQAKWNKLSREKQSKLKARQGISILTLADVDVKDLKTMKSVVRDGKSMGEIVLRGSSIMKGYFKDPNTTSKAFKNGWLLTGDVGVIHPDGYLEIKDRSKDVIISGGENISSVEVESILYGHPRVLEVAVVAMPHSRWGETPCAFVVLNSSRNDDVSELEIVNYCRKNLPHFMVPKKVIILNELPKTATGKIQKFELRLKAKALSKMESKFSSTTETETSSTSHPSSQYSEPILAISRL